jgi:SNF2 family DNA or RNA helicase
MEQFKDAEAKRLSERPEEKPLDRPTCLFLDVEWYRVILDEAHTIRNRNTIVAQALWALEARFRWCLTGTPIQNTIEDIYSLIAFLRFPEYSDWQRFRTGILAPIKKGYAKAKAMKRLQAVLAGILLQRTKDSEIDGVKILPDLPPKSIVVKHATFGPEQEEFYKAFQAGAIMLMRKYLDEGSIGKRMMTTVLPLLTALRQTCDDPRLIKGIREKGSGTECSFCGARSTDPVASLLCRHQV